MRKGVKRAGIAFGGLAGLTVLTSIGVLIAWGATGKPANGQVAPHTEISGMDISNMTSATLDSTLADLGRQLSKEPVIIDVEGESSQIAIQPASFNLQLLEGSTRDRAMRVGRQGNIAQKVWHWLQSFALHRQIQPVLSYDKEKLAAAINAQDTGEKRAVVEPSLSFNDKTKKVVFAPGEPGRGIDHKAVAQQLPEVASVGLPITVSATREDIDPLFNTDDLSDKYETFKADFQEIPVKSGSQSEKLDFATIEPWLRARVEKERLIITADDTVVLKGLESRMSRAGVAAKQATFVINDTTPAFVEGAAGTACCKPDAANAVTKAIELSPTVPETIDLGLHPVAPKFGPQDVEKLGVTKKISTFTTSHAPDQPRVQNIHRIADLTKGTLIGPGEVFSLNGLIGPRTIEKGFVEDHVIVDGKFDVSVGGGISQFSTTLFNAAFFGGLEWTEYQSHSIYINRYPYGREATISYPAPDQKIKNSTPFGVVIWASYTPTSITVDLYSSDYATGEQTGQTETAKGACKFVKTERTLRYVDGRTLKDFVTAMYQPEEGVLCQ